MSALPEGFWVRALAGLRSAFWSWRFTWDARRSGGHIEVDRSVRLRTRVILRGQGTVEIGPDVVLGDCDAGRPGAPILLAPRHASSRIVIGAETRLSNGVEFTAVERIELGSECLIGSDVRIVDADFHGVSPRGRRESGQCSSVVIGDNVWIGMGALVLKGARIGTGAVVGAGAVVVKDVPAATVAAGNPARVVASANKGVRVSASQ